MVQKKFDLLIGYLLLRLLIRSFISKLRKNKAEKFISKLAQQSTQTYVLAHFIVLHILDFGNPGCLSKTSA